MKKIFISTGDLAELLKISDRMVRKHSRSGLFRKLERGKYDLRECVRAYIKMSRKNNKSDQAGLNEERARLTKLQADKVKYELEILHNKYWPLDLIKMTWQTIVKSSSVKILGITNIIKRDIPGIENKVLLKIDEIIRLIIKEMNVNGHHIKLQKKAESHISRRIKIL
jgi:phage terminase Nu1 subunit (DNA packaging protein)